MDEGKDKGINPVEPLGKNEPEPTPTGGQIQYPGDERRGQRIQFPLVGPNVGRRDSKVVHLSVVRNAKNNPPDGSA